MEISRQHFSAIAQSIVDDAVSMDILYDHDENVGESDPREALKTSIVEQLESYFLNVLGFTIA